MTGQARHPWEGLTPDQHEWHYNPQNAVPDFRSHQAGREAWNLSAAASLRADRGIAYGPDPLHALDIYAAAGTTSVGAPVHLFFHGGYWRAQDKANFAFLAEPLVRRGVTAVIANYPLCPRVTLDQVVAAASACLAWVARNIAAHGGDPARITLSGHSAGAHLVASVLAQDWVGRGLAADIVKGALLISGIFDPRPASLTSVNAELRLTPEQIARHDYERTAPRLLCPTWLVAGGEEPWQWIDQSWRYAQHLRRHGIDAGVLVCPGHHHFNIIDQFADDASDLMRLLGRLVQWPG